MSTPPVFDLRRAIVADLHAAGEPALAEMVKDGTVAPSAWIRLQGLPVWALLSEAVRDGVRRAAAGYEPRKVSR